MAWAPFSAIIVGRVFGVTLGRATGSCRGVGGRAAGTSAIDAEDGLEGSLPPPLPDPRIITELGGYFSLRAPTLLSAMLPCARSDPRKISGSPRRGAESLMLLVAGVAGAAAGAAGAALVLKAERSGRLLAPPPLFGWVNELPPIVRPGGVSDPRGVAGAGAVMPPAPPG